MHSSVTLLLQGHDLFLVSAFLLLKGLDVFIAFFHLVFAELNLLLHFVSHLLKVDHVLVLRLLLFFQTNDVAFKVRDGLVPVLQLTLNALILQGVFRDGLFLTKFGCIETFVGLTELFDFVLD